MNPIILIKIFVSVFLINKLFFYGTKYVYLVFQVTPEEKLNSNFRKAWINSFFVLIYFSSLMLLWFPTVFQSDFFSNPLPTLTIVIVTSLIFATLLANSAMQSSRSIIFAQKAIYFLKKKK